MNKFIFDMDGTLYNFKDAIPGKFYDTGFYSDLKKNIYSYLGEKMGFNRERIDKELAVAVRDFNGEYSLYFEKVHGIDRYEYLSKVFSLDPEKHIVKTKGLPEFYAKIKDRSLILTTAPKSWAKKVLTYLEIVDYVGDNLITGEPDIRKPNPLVFINALKMLKSEPENTYSIGDQEHSDIIPAKNIGIKTIIVGKSKSADYEVKDTKELMKLVEELL
ncbi:MAG: HAD family hydrolase [Candidatus ainarchaeum sp.]|nr:HAD family hydrolase [Candidatus ainarchaeum sp.]